MTEPTYLPVSPIARAAAANYARTKKMVPATIAKYESGASDETALLQALAEVEANVRAALMPDTNDTAVGVDLGDLSVISVTGLVATTDADITALQQKLTAAEAELQSLRTDFNLAQSALTRGVEEKQSLNKVFVEQRDLIMAYTKALTTIRAVAGRLWFGRGTAIAAYVDEVIPSK